MSLKDLQNINIKDLKNIDFVQLKESLLGQPVIFVNILLIGLTIFGTIYVYRGFERQAKSLTREAQEKQKKADLVTKVTANEKEYAAYLASFPEYISTDELINKLSQFAADHNVQILTFSPMDARGDGLYEQAGINLNIAAEQYKDMVLFVKKIEESDYALRIDKWSAEMDTQRSGGWSSYRGRSWEHEKDERIRANLEIVSLRIKK